MNTTSATAGLPFNPAMLRWAREWRGRTVDDVVQKLKFKADSVVAWEAGQSAPSLAQAYRLAEFYERPFLEFFLPNPPHLAESELVPDFRLRHDAETESGIRELKQAQAWAEAMRENALDLYSLVGETPPELYKLLASSIDGSPDKAASAVRSLIGPTPERQYSGKSFEFPKVMRASLEGAGVLVLKDASLAKIGVRGMCIYNDPLPVIVFSTEAPSAQAFTIAHELAHIVLRQSAVSGAPSRGDGSSRQSIVEGWCNKFAAAYLVPADSLMSMWAKPNAPVSALGDDILQHFASAFHVSKHAMLIRLVHLGYVESDYYWIVKKPQFDKEDKEYRAFGRSKYYGSRFRSRCGDLYTGLVIEAWETGSITNHNAAELMGTKSFKHLEDIRREFTAT